MWTCKVKLDLIPIHRWLRGSEYDLHGWTRRPEVLWYELIWYELIGFRLVL